jgi:hypothetical protein
MFIIFGILLICWFLLIGSRETQRATEHLQRDMQRKINRRNTRKYARRQPWNQNKY